MEKELEPLLNEAVDRLEEARKAFINKDEKIFSAKVWKAASDVEYATFLMALSRNKNTDEWKKSWKLAKDVDIGTTLLAAQNLLKEAIKALSSDVEETYRKAWLARGHILDVQKKLDKSVMK